MVEEPQPARWSTIIPLLREFEGYLAEDAPRLALVHANDSRWSDEAYRRRRAELKYGSKYGVYLLFEGTEQLRYVGLAMYSFDKRIWSHDGYISRQWTDIIPFEDTWYFLAPALEFFLISRLQPPDNRSYRNDRIGERRPPNTDPGKH